MKLSGSSNWYLSSFYSSILSILYISIFVIFVIYIFIFINIRYIKNNWNTEKCKLGIFIGGEKNINECAKIILKDVVDKSTQPLISGANELKSFYSELSTQVSNSTNMGGTMNNKINNIVKVVTQIISKLAVPIIVFYNTINIVLLRIKAILITQIYFMMASILTLKQFLEMMLNTIINVLIMLAALIIVMMVLPFSWGIAVSFIAIFASISIPLIGFVSIMSKVTDLNILKIPKIPKLRKKPHICFDPYTIIPMKDGSFTYIKYLKVGDVLRSGTIVTAVLILDSTFAKMYSLNNILVTGSHLVKYHNTWIPVDSHPNSIYIPTYLPEQLYCINTTSGFIEIGNMIFTDWDEMLPSDFNPYPINTVVTLYPNIQVKIQDVQINDIIQYPHIPNYCIVTGIVTLIHNKIIQYHLYTEHIG